MSDRTFESKKYKPNLQTRALVIMGSGWSIVAMFTEDITLLDDVASFYNDIRIICFSLETVVSVIPSTIMYK